MKSLLSIIAAGLFILACGVCQATDVSTDDGSGADTYI